MLYISLVFSSILLVVAVFAARPAPQRVRWTQFAVASILLGAGPVLLQCFPTAVLLSIFLLSVALMLWPMVRGRLRHFWPIGVSAVVLTYFLIGTATLQTGSRYARYREENPVESMVDRLPEPTGEFIPLSASTLTRLETLEYEIESGTEYELGRRRARALERLHGEQVRDFVNSPGFGVMRTIPPTIGLMIPPREPTPPQSAEWLSTGSPAVESTPAPDSSVFLKTLHQNGLLDFLNPSGFGYVKDRTSVAGFRPHAFSRPAEGSGMYTVQRVELVSLLLHAEPAVYLLDRLPTMEEVREVPTRPLDPFEAESLKLIRKGEDMTSAAGPDRTRAFGSIRSAKQCVACHGGQRGDLLGAFSYVLREDKATKP